MISASFCDLKPRLITKLFQTLDWCYEDLEKKQISLLDNRFVNRLIHMQNCATAVHLFKAQTVFRRTVQPWPNSSRRSASFSNIFLLNFTSTFRHVASHGRTQKYVNNYVLLLLLWEDLRFLSEILVWNFRTLKKINTSRCVSYVNTLALKLLSVIKQIWIRFDFLRFRICSKNFDRKGLQIQTKFLSWGEFLPVYLKR